MRWGIFLVFTLFTLCGESFIAFHFDYVHVFVQLLIGSLALALDVDFPTRELSGEAGILTFLADSQRQLIVRNDYARNLLGFVNGNGYNLGRAQRVSDELRRVFAPFYDIDFFAAQLVNNGLHTHTAVANAGTNGVHGFVLGPNGNLGTVARFAGYGLDFYDAFLNFGNFQFKEAL